MTSPPPSLRELFETALGLPPADRAAYLDRHCDHERRPRVERMLASDVDAERSAVPGAPMAVVAEALLDGACGAEVPAGSSIGPFELIRVIGEGGSSTVFHARRSVD